MQTTASLLRAGLQTHDHAFRFTLDPRFQGLPDTAHGGTVVAAFDMFAGVAGSRDVTGVYRRRVPLAVPLTLVATRAETVRYVLGTDAGILVEGSVAPSGAPPMATTSPVAGGVPLPVSRTCFACGTENAIGLGLRLAHDDATVHGRFVPDERFRERDGSVSSVAVTALLDEAAFWLGALATGESGMTTDLRLTLHRPARASDALTVVGRRTDATPGPDDERYWITRLAAVADTGDVVASAVITFVVVRGAARRLAAGLSATNPAEVVRAVFPRYVETA